MDWKITSDFFPSNNNDNFSCTFEYIDEYDKFYNFKGLVCPGRPGQCYYPWYTRSDANIIDSDSIAQSRSEWTILSRTCIDKSDQVFPLNHTCPNRTQYLQMAMSTFDCNKYRSTTICRKFDFLPNTITDWVDNPHNCWDSCSEPGENCMGCSNNDYFQCPRSQVCIIVII